MVLITVPESGLSLVDVASSNVENPPSMTGTKPPQAMRLELTEGVLEEILKGTRIGGKGVHLTFGKTVTLHYGNKSQQLLATPQPFQTELYCQSPANKDELSVAGMLSHGLAMKKVQDDLVGTDAALAMLQSQMASHQRDRQSKQIKFVPNDKSLPPPVQQRATAKPTPFAHLKKSGNSGRPNNTTTRSMPTSPALGAARSPLPSTGAPTSAPIVHNEKSQKLQALKTPLIHLLAVRPVSEKFLAQKICCSQEEIREVLQKVGKPARLDSSKWDLSDRSFKELDVWRFEYPNPEDRELAINHAVSAYDRMRLSREEHLWQLLLPKEERGKGTVLSNLHLHGGPIQKSSTPRINVQPTDDAGNGGNTTSNDSDARKDRLAPSDAEPMVRSQSHDQIKKKKVSEKEAQSKRLLSKNPKKAAAGPKLKESNPPVKKGGKKAAAASVGNIKSTEFVHDSDEDEEMEDVLPPKAAESGLKKVPKPAGSTQSDASLKPKPKPKPAEIDDLKFQKTIITAPVKASAKKPLPSSSSSSGSKHRSSDSSQSSIPMTKTLSRQRTTSSPHKPSPLGSSPPTNASDLDNGARSFHSSTASSTPLISQARNRNVTPNRPTTTTSTTTTGAINGMARNTSERSLKRKHDDVDSDIHSHKMPLTNGNTNGQSNGVTNGLTNGLSTRMFNGVTNADSLAVKRHKASDMSPPTSDTSNTSHSPPIRSEVLENAQRFKRFYTKYERLYREVSNWKDAPKEKVDSVKRMHASLMTMKDEIAKGLSGR